MFVVFVCKGSGDGVCFACKLDFVGLDLFRCGPAAGFWICRTKGFLHVKTTDLTMLFGFLSLLCVLGNECVASGPNALSVKCSSCSPLTTVGGGFRIFAFLQAAFYFEGSRAILHPVESR